MSLQSGAQHAKALVSADWGIVVYAATSRRDRTASFGPIDIAVQVVVAIESSEL